jgi:hypothetical protein
VSQSNDSSESDGETVTARRIAAGGAPEHWACHRAAAIDRAPQRGGSRRGGASDPQIQNRAWRFT